MTQLDLFGVSPKNCRPSTDAAQKLVPFPLVRRRRLIGKTAATLTARKTTEGRDAYWTRTIQSLAAELRRHGASQPEIDSQLSEFHRAVGDEIARSSQHHQQPPGAA